MIHFGSAFLFFAALAVFCFFWWRDKTAENATKEPGERNTEPDTAYLWCGLLILVFLLLAALSKLIELFWSGVSGTGTEGRRLR